MLNVFVLEKEFHEIVNVAVFFLKKCPHLKDQLLPILAKSLDFITKSNEHAYNSLLESKVNELLKLYPSNYNLIRFSIYASDPSLSTESLVVKYKTLLPTPLYQTLILQAHLDRGSECMPCQKLIPDVELFTKNNEAAVRLLECLLHPSLAYDQQNLQEVVDKLFYSSEEKHAAFSKILNNTSLVLPVFILQIWFLRDKEDWRAQYYLAHYFARENKIREYYTFINSIFDLILEDVPEFYSVEITCRCLNTIIREM